MEVGGQHVYNRIKTCNSGIIKKYRWDECTRIYHNMSNLKTGIKNDCDSLVLQYKCNKDLKTCLRSLNTYCRSSKNMMSLWMSDMVNTQLETKCG